MFLTVLAFNLSGRHVARNYRSSPECAVSASLLEIDNLSVELATERGPLRAVCGVSLSLEPSRTLGIVGEIRLRKNDAVARDSAAVAGKRAR